MSYREIDVLEQRLAVSLGASQGKLVGAVRAVCCWRREVRPLGERDGVVQTHLDSLHLPLGGAPRVAAHRCRPGARRGEPVRDVLPLRRGRVQGGPVEEQEVSRGNL